MLELLSLPNEILVLIFENLIILNDLLNCRLLNRRCNDLIKSIKIKVSLTVINCKVEYYEEHCENHLNQFLNDELDRSILFRTENAFFIKSKLMSKCLLLKLKRLAISQLDFNTKREWIKFEKMINQLVQLDSLRIHLIRLYTERELKLENIKEFTIDDHACSVNLIIRARNLISLSCELANYEINFLNTITHLATRSFRSNDLSRFKNLKYLKFLSEDKSTSYNEFS